MAKLKRDRPPEQQEGASPEQRKPLLNSSKRRACRMRIHAHTRRMEDINNPLKRQNVAKDRRAKSAINPALGPWVWRSAPAEFREILLAEFGGIARAFACPD